MTLTIQLVSADLLNNANHVSATIKAFGVAAIIGFLVLAITKENHRGAWMAVPMVGIILMIATQGGLGAIQSGTLQIWHLIFG
jgi:hypothetical protein